MSWIRTATALIGFGFTLFQFFDRINQMKGLGPPINASGARTMSLAMIAIGTFAIIVAIQEYRRMLRYLWSPEFRAIAGIGDRPVWTPAFMVATLVALTGVITFVSLIVRLATGQP
jgi:putative membrane protein